MIIIWYGNYSAVLSLSTQPPLNRSMSLKRENKHVVILLYYIFKDKNRNRRSYPVFERFGNLRFDPSCSTRLDRERSREKGRNDSTKSANYILSRNIIFNKRNNFLQQFRTREYSSSFETPRRKFIAIFDLGYHRY